MARLVVKTPPDKGTIKSMEDPFNTPTSRTPRDFVVRVVPYAMSKNRTLWWLILAVSRSTGEVRVLTRLMQSEWPNKHEVEQLGTLIVQGVNNALTTIEEIGVAYDDLRRINNHGFFVTSLMNGAILRLFPHRPIKFSSLIFRPPRGKMKNSCQIRVRIPHIDPVDHMGKQFDKDLRPTAFIGVTVPETTADGRNTSDQDRKALHSCEQFARRFLIAVSGKLLTLKAAEHIWDELIYA
ncbi:hypothetical protein KVT40_003794 [Elsinoe batatas]|uniref:Uncharacterized protein n=1 Tax=Elsinoe batatas TaxID=2601811 RepID=A0A8K0L587_9PEZI|nr:hypothetical protein KVT40_003794 [Elsinoe batatas]